MSHKRKNNFQQGYTDGLEREIKPFVQNESVENPAAPEPSTQDAYLEGYVKSEEREILPFNPNIIVEESIERPIIIRAVGQLKTQSLTPLLTTADGQLLSNDTFSVNPSDGSHMFLVVNGSVIFPANGAGEAASSAFYVTNSAETLIRTQGSFVAGDKFWWNQSIAGYSIETSDTLKIVYEI